MGSNKMESVVATIVIDGVTYEVNPDNNLLQECLSQGLDLPYFCWHPCMGSVGACRQCAVKQYRNEEDQEGLVVMACMTPASDGSIISIEDDQVKKFRANVIESLMISHPHDCPVCEEGGECHLQDMTLMSGHNYRRYDGTKVTHNNQYLGPFVGHEMNRCITCYRCVRYYDEYAGGTDLSAQASHHHTYFGRQTDGFLESEFSGNLVEVCPTGVFTDATFSEHYARKWDLQSAPSVCVGCSVGCNITPGERYGSLRRIVNRYNEQINGYSLCDRGRLGYGFVNSEERFKNSFKRIGDQQLAVSVEEARKQLSSLATQQDGKTIGIGSPRASNEANHALLQFVGAENFYAGNSDNEFDLLNAIIDIQGDPQFNTPSIREIEQADAVLIVGEDVTNVAPRVALALRQSVHNRAEQLAAAARIPIWQDAAVRELAQDEKSPLYILSGYASRLDDVARYSAVDSIDNLAKITTAIARKLSADAPVATGRLSVQQRALVDAVVADLQNAERPLVVCGSSNGSLDLLHAAANVSRALADSREGSEAIDFACLVPEVNSIGMGLMNTKGNNLGNALQRMQSGEVETAIVVENDLYRRAVTSDIDSAIDAVKQLVVIDLLPSPTTAKADLVLACTSFAEQESTYVNYEGRAQLSMQVFDDGNDCLPVWSWLGGKEMAHFESVVQDCESTHTAFKGLCKVLADRSLYGPGMKVPRQSHRYSGRTAMNASANVHEPKQAEDAESIMSFSMEGVSPLKDSSILASTWAPQWNSNQSISKFQDEVAGELKQGNPGNRIVSKREKPASYYSAKSKNKRKKKGAFRAIPAFQIFGSDEMTNKAAPIMERLIGSYVAISPTDAAKLQLVQNDSVELKVDDVVNEFSVCVREKVKTGTVAIFNGQGGFLNLQNNCSVELNKSVTAGAGKFDNLIVSDLYEEGN